MQYRQYNIEISVNVFIITLKNGFAFFVFVCKTIVNKLNQSLVNILIIVIKLDALSSVSAYSFDSLESATIPPPA